MWRWVTSISDSGTDPSTRKGVEGSRGRGIKGRSGSVDPSSGHSWCCRQTQMAELHTGRLEGSRARNCEPLSDTRRAHHSESTLSGSSLRPLDPLAPGPLVYRDP